MTPSKVRRDSAGESLEPKIGHCQPTPEISVSAGQSMFFDDSRQSSIGPGDFELYCHI